MDIPKISVGHNYRFISKLGKGSFGDVYLALDKEENKYALKVEPNNSKNRLKGEYYIYKRFAAKNLDCVPNIYRFIDAPDQNILVMQLLGKSLDIIFEECNNKLDFGTVIKLAITIISHLEKIHRVGIIHRDIKPNNFMFGIDNETNKLYIMDFGLSKKWLIDGEHIEYKTGRSMIGTARYASVNIHVGTEPSRRDDMESVGYMLVYLIKGSLPWQGLKKKTKENPIDKIGEKKMMIDMKLLCESMPECFYEYIMYTRNLKFTEKPNYDYLRSLFITSAKKHNIEIKYFWETFDDGNNNTDTTTEGPLTPPGPIIHNNQTINKIMNGTMMNGTMMNGALINTVTPSRVKRNVTGGCGNKNCSAMNHSNRQLNQQHVCNNKRVKRVPLSDGMNVNKSLNNISEQNKQKQICVSVKTDHDHNHEANLYKKNKNVRKSVKTNTKQPENNSEESSLSTEIIKHPVTKKKNVKTIK